MRIHSLFLASVLVLSPVHVSAENSPCVDVEIGGEKATSHNCLNRRLQEKVGSVKPPANVPPIGGSSPAVTLGGFNQQALKQQYGSTFGTSSVPYRPQQTYPSLR